MTTTLVLEPPPATTDNPHVIGLDTSLTATGIASSRGWCCVIGYTNKRHPITKLGHQARLDAMRKVRLGVIDSIGQPDLAVMEAPSFASSGGGGHERGWLWWRIFEYLDDAEIPVALLVPKQRAKYATGNGNADKKAVLAAVKEHWPSWEVRSNDNLADAVVLMAAGRDHLGYPLTEMPKANRAALDKAVWPEMAVAS